MLKFDPLLVPTLGDHCEVEIDMLRLIFCTAIDRKSVNVLQKDGADRSSWTGVQNF